MPPWLDWLDWLKWDCIGAGALGKILGVWFGFCISIVRKLLRWTLSSTGSTSNAQISHQVQPIQTGRSLGGKLTNIAVSTLLTLAVWVVITWKPVWSAAGPEGDIVLTVVLILTSAAWPISSLWILFSKPKRMNTTGTLRLRPPRYLGSDSARAR